MKFQKLLLGTAAACFMFGASSAAIAEGCPGGIITLDSASNIRISDVSCTLIGISVDGSVFVTNSPSFTMLGSVVTGRVVVTGGNNTAILDNTVFGQTIRVEGAIGDVVLSNNIVTSGNIAARDNVSASFPDDADSVLIYSNTVGGNIWCRNNEFELASKNIAGGEISCDGQ